MKTKVIGLTGGIGSGKSTIARYFESLGVPVYIADDEAKKIFFEPDVITELKNTFGPEVFTDGMPDRAKLAQLVFNDRAKLALLNAIIHPRVALHFSNWLKSNTGRLFVMKEAAILFESGSYKECDAIILVTAPDELRIKRVIMRDGITRNKVLMRMANQWDDQKKAAMSDYIINNTDLELAKQQAVNILNTINNINK